MLNFKSTLVVLSPVLVLTALTACGGSSGLQTTLTEPASGDQATDELADGSDSTSDDSDSSWGSNCTYDAFPVQMAQATQNNSDPDRPLFVYQGRNFGGTPFDELQLASYQGAPYNGPSRPGSYSLDGSNYEDCALCGLLIMDCDAEYACEKVLFADEGVVHIDNMSGNGGRFKATLDQVVFREVTIDSSTYESTPVSGGDTWCVDGLTLDVDTRVL